MGIRKSSEMAERLKSMLARDKTGVKDGFVSALNSDLNRLLSDYFDLLGRAEIKIEREESGDYEISFAAHASKIKGFDSTYDVPGL